MPFLNVGGQGPARKIVIAVLLFVGCLSYFTAARAATTDPTPSQIVAAIKRAHLESIVARDPSLASQFVVYGDDKWYGPHPGDSGFDAFSLSLVGHQAVNGHRFILVAYIEGNAVCQQFAFFAGSLSYAGKLPCGSNVSYHAVGKNLIVSLHTLRSGDPYCCPTGPLRTLATFSANSHDLYAVVAGSTPASAAVTEQKAAVAALVSAERVHGTSSVEGASCLVIQAYAQCDFTVGNEDKDRRAWLHLKNGKWAFLGELTEKSYDAGFTKFGSFAVMLEKLYGIPAVVAKQFVDR